MATEPANSVTMVVQPHVAQSIAAQGERPEKFSGNDFKRWHQKMLFYLTTLNLARFVSEEVPIVSEGENDTQKRVAMDAWGHGDFLCRNYILNDLVIRCTICIAQPRLQEPFGSHWKRNTKQRMPA
ncbi:hypothetical protein Sango_2956200 [Sesamum angolense]|uniref:Zinc finger, CCHC-type n=1 Tax=Sesamum angolense TaxID=2727404 RepID=A0AAE1VUS2_9LAMI|nr:hypothetical protein Sango_2956200 [Sesamum angolense]